MNLFLEWCHIEVLHVIGDWPIVAGNLVTDWKNNLWTHKQRGQSLTRLHQSFTYLKLCRWVELSSLRLGLARGGAAQGLEEQRCLPLPLRLELFLLGLFRCLGQLLPGCSCETILQFLLGWRQRETRGWKQRWWDGDENNRSRPVFVVATDRPLLNCR